MQKIKIAPSILSADLLRMENEILSIEKSGADLIHIDIMDGHFVPNLTFGPDFVKTIRKITRLPLDVHLMISNPEKFIDKFIFAGADYLSFHIETNSDHKKLLNKIKKNSGVIPCNKQRVLHRVNPGIAINPDTSLDKIEELLDLIDFVLIMTVFPGFGGQEYILDCTQKISDFVDLQKNKNIEIEVDGGINFETAKISKNAGANILASGNFIFNNDNYKKVIDGLRNV